MRALYKKNKDFTAWDMNAGCRKWIDQSTPARRRLKKKLRRVERKKIDKIYDEPVDNFCSM